MPPPLEARETFSFQTRWMPSRLSCTEFRKQEIGRPRFEFVGAQVSPDVFDWVQFRSVGRQVQEGYVVRDGESYRSVPSGPVEDEERMG